MAKSYDTTPLPHAETRMCGHLTTVCEVQKDEAVHWCASCERFSDEAPCHRCKPCATCVAELDEWNAWRAAHPPTLRDPYADDEWEQIAFEFWRAA